MTGRAGLVIAIVMYGLVVAGMIFGIVYALKFLQEWA